MTRALPPAHEQQCLAQNGRNTMTFRLVIDRDNRLIWLIHRIPRPSFSGDAANTDWCGVIVPQEQAIKLHERCCTAQRKSSAAADEYGVLKRYSGRHETAFQNDRDSAGRLERNVRRHAVG